MVGSQSRAKIQVQWKWLAMAALTIMTLGLNGASGSSGVFLKPMVEALNLTRTSASSAVSMFMGINGVTSIYFGRLIDKYGPRAVIIAGVILGFLGYLLMSQVTSLWQMQIFLGVMAGASMGACFTAILTIVSKWFTDKRVMAMGFITAGVALGQMSVPILMAYIIANNGWRMAYIVMAAILLLTSIPAAVLLGVRPGKSPTDEMNWQGQKAARELNLGTSGQVKKWSAGEAARTLPFWIVILISLVMATGFYSILVHIVAYAMDAGIPAVQAASILTYANLAVIAAQFLAWFLARRIGSKFTIILMLGMQAIMLFLLMGTTSFIWLVVLVLVFYAGYGSGNTIRLAMISEVFGTKSVGSIIGFISLAWAAGGIIGPMLGGYIYDVSHSYKAAFLVGGLLLTIGTISGFFIRAHKG
jgi:MFS family permease